MNPLANGGGGKLFGPLFCGNIVPIGAIPRDKTKLVLIGGD